MRFSVEVYFWFSGEVRSFPNLANVSFALMPAAHPQGSPTLELRVYSYLNFNKNKNSDFFIQIRQKAQANAQVKIRTRTNAQVKIRTRTNAQVKIRTTGCLCKQKRVFLF
jgi:hypothetical protein